MPAGEEPPSSTSFDIKSGSMVNIDMNLSGNPNSKRRGMHKLEDKDRGTSQDEDLLTPLVNQESQELAHGSTPSKLDEERYASTCINYC
jgi:hypothetical protein